MNPPVNLRRERLFWHEQITVCGVDEAGRGPLAGPVVAAAVILPFDFKVLGLDDSKKLSAKEREKYFATVSKCAVAVGVGIVTHREIDRINIHQASLKAMRLAVEQLSVPVDQVLLDGRFTIPNLKAAAGGKPVAQNAIVGGDRKSASIAAASVIAKVTRDRIMLELDEQYPQYGFKQHKGYGTKAHFAAIKRHGLSPVHRKSFCGSVLK